MERRFENIVFFYPSIITGGAEYLFLRCAEYLAENQTDYKIYISDYSDGFLKRNIKSQKITFLEYQKGKLTSVPKRSLVVVQLNLLVNLKEKLQFDEQDASVLYWCLHFLNLKSCYHVKGVYLLRKKERKLLGQAVHRLTSMNVIKFMALSAYCIVGQDLGLKAEEFDWLPNIAPISESVEPPTFSCPKGRIRFCWLGRLDEEKSRNIATYMNELEALSKYYDLSLSLIGLGEAEQVLREKAATLHYEINFVGEKRGNELDRFIRENVDVGLASGTSALEMSLRGKPVVVENVLTKEYPAGERDSYYLTYETTQYTISNDGSFVRTCTSTFSEKLKQVLDNYEKESHNCFDFVINQGPSNCCEKLINTVKEIEKVDTAEMHSAIMDATRLLEIARNRNIILSKIKRLFVKS